MTTQRGIPSYTDFIEGKRLTKKQHARRMKQYEELYGKINLAGELVKVKKAPEEEQRLRSGQCPDCRHGGFKLEIIQRELLRTCMSCGRKDHI